MKKLSVFSAMLMLVGTVVSAQPNANAEINRLEQLEITSIYKADTATLLQVWSKDFVCNNPYGVIVVVPEILGFIKKGEIDYSSAQRIVERVTFIQNIAISMGKELMKAQGNTPYAGKTITMRYTHTWIQTNGKWQLAARQAAMFSVE